MADKIIVSKSKVTALFDAIRNKAGVTGEKTFEEMTEIVNNMSTQAPETPEPTIFTITITNRNTSGSTTVYVLAVEQSMTWADFCESSYNNTPLDLHVSSGYVFSSLGAGYAIKDSSGRNVSSTATITTDAYTYSDAS